MTNRERKILAFFLTRVDEENECLAGDFLREIKDEKLKLLYEEYTLGVENIEAMRDTIRETSVDLWSSDFPEFHKGSYGLNKKYRAGNYWRLAVEYLKKEFERKQDFDSLDTLSLISST